VAFRGDAAFARPEIYEAHEARQVKYAIRLPANANLERRITKLLIRPWEDRATSQRSAKRASSIRRRVGARHGAW